MIQLLYVIDMYNTYIVVTYVFMYPYLELGIPFFKYLHKDMIFLE